MEEIKNKIFIEGHLLLLFSERSPIQIHSLLLFESFLDVSKNTESFPSRSWKFYFC